MNQKIKCPFCLNETFSQSFPVAKKTIPAAFFECSVCYSIVPVFDKSLHEKSIAWQVNLHEEMWVDEFDDTIEQIIVSAKSTVKYFEQYLPYPRGNGLVADIGFGRGNMSFALAEMGYQVHACEPSPNLFKAANRWNNYDNLIFENATIDEFIAGIQNGKKFDAIFLWHVLEHIESPFYFLKKLYENLTFGGCLIVQGPVISERNVFPEHYYLHSLRQVEWVAEQLQMAVCEINFDPVEHYLAYVIRKKPVYRSQESFKNYLANNDELGRFAIAQYPNVYNSKLG